MSASISELTQVNNMILTAIYDREVARMHFKKVLIDILYVCPVCMLHVKETTETSCGHRFCTPCTKKWLKNHDTCPNCRCEVRKELEKELELGPALLKTESPQRSIRFFNIGDSGELEGIGLEIESHIVRRLQDFSNEAFNNAEELESILSPPGSQAVPDAGVTVQFAVVQSAGTIMQGAVNFETMLY